MNKAFRLAKIVMAIMPSLLAQDGSPSTKQKPQAVIYKLRFNDSNVFACVYSKVSDLQTAPLPGKATFIVIARTNKNSKARPGDVFFSGKEGSEAFQLMNGRSTDLQIIVTTFQLGCGRSVKAMTQGMDAEDPGQPLEKLPDLPYAMTASGTTIELLARPAP